MSQKHTVHIAAGVLHNTQGQYLLSSRPTGKSKAGYWEFAGGKIEANESPFAALQREFQEELGIHVHHAQPWLTRIHYYPEKIIKLHLFYIAATNWSGELESRENQQWQWQNPQDQPNVRVLPSNLPILQALRIPRQLKGSLEHGLDGHNGYRVCPAQQAQAQHPVLLQHDQTLAPEQNAAAIWRIIHNRQQYRTTTDANAWLWQPDSSESLNQLQQVLRQGTPQPLIIYTDRHTANEHGKQWHKLGAHAIIIAPQAT